MNDHLIMYAPIGSWLALLAQGWRLCLDRFGDPRMPAKHGDWSVMVWRRA